MLRVPLTGVAVLVALLAATPVAHGRLPSSIETTVAPGGNASIASPTLDPAMRSATVDVAPAGSEDEELFKTMRVVLSLQPTPGARLMACVTLYQEVQAPDEDGLAMLLPEEAQPLAVLLLAACLHMAAEVNRAAQASPSAVAAAAPACGRTATQVPARFTRVGRKWKATIDGTTAPLRRRGRLVVSCRRKNAGITLKVRPAARGRTLRSVVGPRLRLGVYNPLEATGSARLRLTFRR